MDCNNDSEMTPVPDEEFHDIRPSPNSRGLSAVARYGMHRFSDLYNERQLIALVTLTKLIRKRNEQNDGRPLSAALSNLLALCLGRVADYGSAESRWDATQERNVNAFGRQALPMLWDYSELVPVADCVGSWDSMLNSILRVVERTSVINRPATTDNADATEHPLLSESATCLFTDPPYYDSVPYADLADFFYVWLKRVRPSEPLLRNRFEGGGFLTPKLRECVWNAAYSVNGRKKDPQFFEECITRAFREGRRITNDQGAACIVFAHKTTKGWEALLSGLIRSKWVVFASWPIATEQRQRLVARDSAALATSIHLICRPRPDSAPIGDWANVLRELPSRVADWMDRLQEEGVRGADLVFACIGPALEIFSRYSKVETAEGREVRLPEFLEKVWEVVGRTALEQVLGTAEAQSRNGAAGTLEEDARLTALFLWTLQSTNGETAQRDVVQASNLQRVNDEDDTTEEEQVEDEGEDEDKTDKMTALRGYNLAFDVVRRFAQPLGIHLPDWEGRIIETKKGVVRLLSVHERSEQLFGKAGADIVADRLEHAPTGPLQLELFPNRTEETAPKVKGSGRRRSGRLAAEVSDESLRTRREATTLDRVHAAMLLQASGRTNALRALLRAEIERGPDFLRLANALSALYPTGSEEERLLDAMLLAVPR
jgi:adenine-specific DNA methylase